MLAPLTGNHLMPVRAFHRHGGAQRQMSLRRRQRLRRVPVLEIERVWEAGEDKSVPYSELQRMYQVMMTKERPISPRTALERARSLVTLARIVGMPVDEMIAQYRARP